MLPLEGLRSIVWCAYNIYTTLNITTNAMPCDRRICFHPSTSTQKNLCIGRSGSARWWKMLPCTHVLSRCCQANHMCALYNICTKYWWIFHIAFVNDERRTIMLKYIICIHIGGVECASVACVARLLSSNCIQIDQFESNQIFRLHGDQLCVSIKTPQSWPNNLQNVNCHSKMDCCLCYC